MPAIDRVPSDRQSVRLASGSACRDTAMISARFIFSQPPDDRLCNRAPAAVSCDFLERLLGVGNPVSRCPLERHSRGRGQAVVPDVTGHCVRLTPDLRLVAVADRERDEAQAREADREIVEDQPIPDRELLREVRAPTMLICREGDEIHRAEVGRILAGVMPNAELWSYQDDASLFDALPEILQRVNELLR